MKIELLKPILDTPAGCLCCPSSEHTLCLQTRLYNGFGGWSITRNGALFYQAENNADFDGCKTVAEIEEIAKIDPDNDWRAELFLPLREATYQRHGDDKWMLVRVGEGFA